jgi:hypothetical protein
MRTSDVRNAPTTTTSRFNYDGPTTVFRLKHSNSMTARRIIKNMINCRKVLSSTRRDSQQLIPVACARAYQESFQEENQ